MTLLLDAIVPGPDLHYSRFGGYKSEEISVREKFFNIQNKNTSWGAEVKSFGEDAHVVVVDGISPEGTIMIRDPQKATEYELHLNDFFHFWWGRGIYKD